MTRAMSPDVCEMCPIEAVLEGQRDVTLAILAAVVALVRGSTS